MYDTADDVNMRLRGTFVKYKGELVYLDDVGNTQVALQRANGERFNADWRKAEDFDIKPLKLGYLNFNRGAGYTARTPHRRWKQATGRDAIEIIQGESYREFEELMRALEAGEKDQYPSFAEAFNQCRKGGNSCAFHRRFALFPVDGKSVLYYRGRAVGGVRASKPFLNENFNFLKEELAAALEG